MAEELIEADRKRRLKMGTSQITPDIMVVMDSEGCTMDERNIPHILH